MDINPMLDHLSEVSIFEAKYAAITLSALIGARLTDTLVSHCLLYVLGYRPNPGLASTLLCIVEAGFLIATFLKGLTAGGGITYLGLAIGAFAFWMVLPFPLVPPDCQKLAQGSMASRRAASNLDGYSRGMRVNVTSISSSKRVLPKHKSVATRTALN